MNATSKRMLHLFQMASRGTGFSAAVLFGIFAHETAEGTSMLWLDATNPAGIKHVRSFFITTAFGVAGNGRDSRYPNELMAVAALVYFLRQSRYLGARNRDDATAISMIGRAGFVEHVRGEPENWIRGVSRYAAAAAKLL